MVTPALTFEVSRRGCLVLASFDRTVRAHHKTTTFNFGTSRMAIHAEDEFSLATEDIPKPSGTGAVSAAKVAYGKLIPPQQQILLFSADEWEAFVEEWAHYQ